MKTVEDTFRSLPIGDLDGVKACPKRIFRKDTDSRTMDLCLKKIVAVSFLLFFLVQKVIFGLVFDSLFTI